MCQIYWHRAAFGVRRFLWEDNDLVEARGVQHVRDNTLLPFPVKNHGIDQTVWRARVGTAEHKIQIA